MSSRQHIIKPADITCFTCGKSVPRSKGFFMCEYEFCSIQCLEPMRKQRIEKEQEAEIAAAKQKQQGAFTFHNGGGHAF